MGYSWGLQELTQKIDTITEVRQCISQVEELANQFSILSKIVKHLTLVFLEFDIRFH